jgi:CheY-like chemotaxis protein
MAHILIAEDEIGQAHLIEVLCQLWGHTTRLAANGEEALDCLDGERFDLLLLDGRMPFMDGITLAYILRRGRTHQHVPIIGMTAMTPDEQVLFRQAGVEAIVQKPFAHETLRGAIEGLLSARSQAS